MVENIKNSMLTRQRLFRSRPELNWATALLFWYTMDERAAFKFGRRVHFALGRKMLKPPIARLAAIYIDLINRPSGEADCVYETKVK